MHHSSLSFDLLTVPATKVMQTIRGLALSLPETYEDRPWGFPVFKVADNKLFVAYDLGGWSKGMNRDVYGRTLDIAGKRE